MSSSTVRGALFSQEFAFKTPGQKTPTVLGYSTSKKHSTSTQEQKKNQGSHQTTAPTTQKHPKKSDNPRPVSTPHRVPKQIRPLDSVTHPQQPSTKPNISNPGTRAPKPFKFSPYQQVAELETGRQLLLLSSRRMNVFHSGGAKLEIRACVRVIRLCL
jgi:hypothetical protein